MITYTHVRSVTIVRDSAYIDWYVYVFSRVQDGFSGSPDEHANANALYKTFLLYATRLRPSVALRQVGYNLNFWYVPAHDLNMLHIL